GEQMRSAGVPASAKSVAQLQPHARVTRNIEDVSCFHTVLGHDPKLAANAGVAYWSAAWLSGLATGGFQERISGRRQADSKQKLNRRIEQVFLKQVNNPTFHFPTLTACTQSFGETLCA